MKRFIPLFVFLLSAPAWSATCKISEYREIIKDASGLIVPVASEPAITTQTVTYTTSTQSAAFNSATRYVRIICDAKAHFVFSANPTATANSPYVAADSAEYFGIGYQTNSAATFEVAFYDGSS